MCGLSMEIITKHDLHEGDEISQDEIDIMIFQEERMKIRNRAYKLLAYRDRSTKEMEQRLIEKGYDGSLVREIIKELVDVEMLDDERFAHAFVHDYTHVTLRGDVFIQKELRKKGIPVSLINRELATRNERDLALRYIERKLSDLDVQVPGQRQKLVRRLLNNGFSSSLVYEIIAEKQNEHEKH